jgi:inner membrane protein
MDTVTHALLGAQVGRLGEAAASRLSLRARLLLGAGAAASPDLDFLAFPIDPLRFLADWHQGPTHALPLLPLWALLPAALCCALTRQPRAFGEAWRISLLALASHAALDLITAYGTQLAYPFSTQRYSLPLSFVLDPIFSLLVVLGLVAGRRQPGWRAALVALLLLAPPLLLQAGLRAQALQLARAQAQVLGITPQRIEALPQPYAPWRWKLVLAEPAQHHIAQVDLLADTAPPAWQRRTLLGEHAGQRALAGPLWQRADFAAFRRFAVFPALSAIEDSPERRCVWFTDLRYDLPGWPDTFRYGYCQQPPGAAWRLHRLRYFSRDGLQALGPP